MPWQKTEQFCQRLPAVSPGRMRHREMLLLPRSALTDWAFTAQALTNAVCCYAESCTAHELVHFRVDGVSFSVNCAIFRICFLESPRSRAATAAAKATTAAQSSAVPKCFGLTSRAAPYCCLRCKMWSLPGGASNYSTVL